MVPITIKPVREGRVELGRPIEFEIERSDPALETRALLKHRHIFYLSPASEWTTEPTCAVFPEAPGHYRLAVQWRLPGGPTGWVEQPFEVVAATAAEQPTAPADDDVPQAVELADGTRLWAPSGWESALLPTADYPVLAALSELVTPGAVAYDVGASIGRYTVHLAQLVGPAGMVYSIEANPVAVLFLSLNLRLNHLDNCAILPAALVDDSGEIGFRINYANVNLGLSQLSQHFSAKAGHEIKVMGHNLDSLIGTFQLRPPDVVKIDIEGAEGAALRGMADTLTKHTPILVLELHGEDPARETLSFLEPLGYRFRVPSSGDAQLLAADETLSKFGRQVFEAVAIPPE